MSLRVSAVIALLVSLLLINGCDRGQPASMSTAPTRVPATADQPPPMTSAIPPVTGPQRRSEVTVQMHDNCDPETFNARIGPGACAGPGGLRFDNFIAELTRNGFVGSWHFAPSEANVVVGQTFVAINKGGEEHTFTEVDEFGGGIIPQ